MDVWGSSGVGVGVGGPGIWGIHLASAAARGFVGRVTRSEINGDGER